MLSFQHKLENTLELPWGIKGHMIIGSTVEKVGSYTANKGRGRRDG